METAALKKVIEKTTPKALLQCLDFGKSTEGCAWIESSLLLESAKSLSQQPDLVFDWLENLSAMQMDEVIVFTYFLRSRETKETAILRSSVSLKKPEDWIRFPSVVEAWPSALEQEREISELFGVEFYTQKENGAKEGTKSKGEILGEGFQGFPLRKYFVFEKEIITPDAGDLE